MVSNKRQYGFTAIEVIVVVALLSSVLLVAIGGVGVASRTSWYRNNRVTAESIATTQLESVKSSAWNSGGVYPTVVPSPGYQIFLTVTPLYATPTPASIQRVTVIVRKTGQADYIVDGYKVNR